VAMQYSPGKSSWLGCPHWGGAGRNRL